MASLSIGIQMIKYYAQLATVPGVGRRLRWKGKNMNKQKLNETGKKIDDVVKIIKDKFDKEKLEDFIAYTHRAEAIAPLVAFEQYQKLPDGAVDEARKRAKLLLKIKELKDF